MSALHNQRTVVQILTRRNVASVLLIEALGGAVGYVATAFGEGGPQPER